MNQYKNDTGTSKILWNKNNLDTQKCPKDADRMGNSVDREQIAKTSLIWVYTF